jgi:glycosyltransferase involved in cell wall biosynthesis
MTITLPKISIVMVVLNRDKTIEKAIKSVIDQQYPNLEFIIIDGGSTDNTVAIISRYENHLAYWHSKHDGSPGLAVELGIKKATGDLIALLMADDWYEPNIFEKISAAYLDKPEADMFTCAGQIVTQDKNSALNKTQWLYTKESELRLKIGRAHV